MVNYRRNRIADGTYFFTVTLRNRQSNALVREIDTLRDAWRAAKTRIPHVVIASVVLPDHLHAVIEMRDGIGDDSRLWQDIKKGFTRRTQPPGATASPWQSRFREHTIRDEADLHAHVDYVHINPMKHGLVERVADWPHSSFHRYVRNEVLPVDWAGVQESLGDLGRGDPRCSGFARWTSHRSNAGFWRRGEEPPGRPASLLKAAALHPGYGLGLAGCSQWNSCAA